VLKIYNTIYFIISKLLISYFNYYQSLFIIIIIIIIIITITIIINKRTNKPMCFNSVSKPFALHLHHFSVNLVLRHTCFLFHSFVLLDVQYLYWLQDKSSEVPLLNTDTRV
jgi:hypothetical protein